MPFIGPAEMVSAEPLPGWRGRYFHSESMTFAVYDVDADAVPIHQHHHPEEEVWNVVVGEIAVWIDGVERTLGPGDAAVIPPNTPHRARTLGASRAVVVDHPQRRQIPGKAHSR